MNKNTSDRKPAGRKSGTQGKEKIVSAARESKNTQIAPEVGAAKQDKLESDLSSAAEDPNTINYDDDNDDNDGNDYGYTDPEDDSDADGDIPSDDKEDDPKSTNTPITGNQNLITKAMFEDFLKDPEIDAMMRARYGSKDQPVISSGPITATLAGDESVTLIHMQKCMGGIGTPIKYGQGKMRKFFQYGECQDMSIREFEQELAPSPTGKALLDQRIIIVGDNCPKMTRDRLKLNYEDGEFLSLEQVDGLFEIPIDTLTKIFEKLCDSQKAMVAKIFSLEIDQGGNRATREKVGALNKISKRYVGPNEPGMFAAILEQIDADNQNEY